MKTVTFTEFRRHASTLLDDVENGEIIRILRHGHPVAEVTPLPNDSSGTPSWQRPGLKLVSKGLALSKVILTERSLS